MFDTLAVAQQLAAGGVARETRAEVIAQGDPRRSGARRPRDPSDQFRAGLAEVRAEIAAAPGVGATLTKTTDLDHNFPLSRLKCWLFRLRRGRVTEGLSPWAGG